MPLGRQFPVQGHGFDRPGRFTPDQSSRNGRPVSRLRQSVRAFIVMDIPGPRLGPPREHRESDAPVRRSLVEDDPGDEAGEKDERAAMKSASPVAIA